MLTFTTSLVLILSTATSNTSAAVAAPVAEIAPQVETVSNTLLTADLTKLEDAKIATRAQDAVKNKANPIEGYVRAYFAKTPILAEIAFCESRFTHFTKTGEVVQGRQVPADTGVMQINKTYHLKTAQKLGINLDTLEGNLAYAKYLYDTQGVQPWSASQPCWGKHKQISVSANI
jgi:hypothetical protein